MSQTTAGPSGTPSTSTPTTATTSTPLSSGTSSGIGGAVFADPNKHLWASTGNSRIVERSELDLLCPTEGTASTGLSGSVLLLQSGAARVSIDQVDDFRIFIGSPGNAPIYLLTEYTEEGTNVNGSVQTVSRFPLQIGVTILPATSSVSALPVDTRCGFTIQRSDLTGFNGTLTHVWLGTWTSQDFPNSQLFIFNLTVAGESSTDSSASGTSTNIAANAEPSAVESSHFPMTYVGVPIGILAAVFIALGLYLVKRARNRKKHPRGFHAYAPMREDGVALVAAATPFARRQQTDPFDDSHTQSTHSHAASGYEASEFLRRSSHEPSSDAGHSYGDTTERSISCVGSTTLHDSRAATPSFMMKRALFKGADARSITSDSPFSDVASTENSYSSHGSTPTVIGDDISVRSDTRLTDGQRH